MTLCIERLQEWVLCDTVNHNRACHNVTNMSSARCAGNENVPGLSVTHLSRQYCSKAHGSIPHETLSNATTANGSNDQSQFLCLLNTCRGEHTECLDRALYPSGERHLYEIFSTLLPNTPKAIYALYPRQRWM